MHSSSGQLPFTQLTIIDSPPPEYLPNKEEKKKWEETDPDEREKKYLPAGYDALRKVPAYDTFVKETFERFVSLPLLNKDQYLLTSIVVSISTSRPVLGEHV